MPIANLPEIPDMSADRLTSQLYHLPAIIGRLGLSVANAQSALNADYTQNVMQLIAMIKYLVPAAEESESPESKDTITNLIKQLAPSRYQFTETTLDFSADLSESLDVAGSIGLGAGFGAVVINAGLSVGFGRDYRAAARIKTILHAIPADQTITDKLIAQANKLTDGGVALPPRTEASTAVNNNLREIVKMAGGKDLPKLPPELPLSPLQQAERAANDAEKYRITAEAFKDNAIVAKESAKKAETEATNANKAIDTAPPEKKAGLADQAESQARVAKDNADTTKRMVIQVSNAIKASNEAAATAETAKEKAKGDDSEPAKHAADRAKKQADQAKLALTPTNNARKEATDAADKAEKQAVSARKKVPK